MILETLNGILEQHARKGLLRIIDDHTETGVDDVFSSPRVVDFYSNDYLNITTDPAIHRDLVETLYKESAPLIGAGGVRTTSGNTPYHTALERRIAAIYDVEAALLFNSGWDANYGIFSSIPQLPDIILFDELSHASVRDGIRASRARRKLAFKHNDVADLQRLFDDVKNEAGVLVGACNVFVAIETLYSMDGDIAPLRELASAMKAAFPAKNVYLITDEAHSSGVFGDKGKGLVNEEGIEEACFIQLHTFSKGLGTIGAVVLCPSLVRTYLVNFAKSFRYSTAQPKMNLVAIGIVYDFLQSPERDVRAARLFEVSKYMRDSLLRAGFTLIARDSQTCPVVCLRIARPREISAWLQKQGFYVTPVTYPIVPLGTDRLRMCVHANNTYEDVDDLVLRLQVCPHLTKM